MDWLEGIFDLAGIQFEAVYEHSKGQHAERVLARIAFWNNVFSGACAEKMTPAQWAWVYRADPRMDAHPNFEAWLSYMTRYRTALQYFYDQNPIARQHGLYQVCPVQYDWQRIGIYAAIAIAVIILILR